MTASIMRRAVRMLCTLGSLSLLLATPDPAAALPPARIAASSRDDVIAVDAVAESTVSAGNAITPYRVADPRDFGGCVSAGYGRASDVMAAAPDTGVCRAPAGCGGDGTEAVDADRTPTATGVWPSVYGWAVTCLTAGIIILCLAHADRRNGEGHVGQ